MFAFPGENCFKPTCHKITGAPRFNSSHNIMLSFSSKIIEDDDDKKLRHFHSVAHLVRTNKLKKLVTGVLLFAVSYIFLSLYQYNRFVADSIASDISALTKRKKFAYALLLDTVLLECPTRILASRLKRLDPHSDVVVFTTTRSPGTQPNIHIPAATKIIPVKPASSLGRWTWRNSFSKFQAGRLDDYDAVMFLDLDNFVLQSPRYLFDLMSLSKDVAAPAAYWLGSEKEPYYFSGGPMIFRPSKSLSDRLGKVLDGGDSRVTHDGDMNWFNEEFKDDLQVLDYMIPDGFDTNGKAVQKVTYALNDEFKSANELFKLGEMLNFKNPSEVLEKSTMVHFIASWKPWENPIREKVRTGEATKELKYLLALYDSEKSLVCDSQ